MSAHQAKQRCLKCGKVVARGSLSSWFFPKRVQCNCKTRTRVKDPSSSSKARLLVAPEASLTGEVLKQRYEIQDLLGSGGMASVYRARDVSTGSTYAVKVISSMLGDQGLLAQRLEVEANAARALNHPAICAVHDSGETASGSAYLLMDFIDGQTLDTILDKEESLSEARAIELFLQVCRGLAHAHEKNVIHRDLKPSNLMLDEVDGHDNVKILDFGIAKITGEDQEDKTKLTQTGELIGSPLYMSPEQCRGDQLDGRSDIYSFGCLMYEVLCGHTPFSGENPIKIIIKHLSNDPPPLPDDISRGLQTVVARCLEKDALDRYQSASELLEDLQRVKDGKAVPAYAQKRKPARASRLLIACTALLPMVCFLLYLSIFDELSSRPPLRLARNARDSADLAGIQAMNSGEYVVAEKSFKEALAYTGISDEDRFNSLEKLALLARIKNNKDEEQELNRQISEVQAKMASKQPGFDLRSLLETMRSIIEDPSAQERTKRLRTFSKDLVFAAESFNANGDPDSTNQLLQVAIPLMEKDAVGATELYLLQAKQAEALMIAKTALLSTRMLDPHGATAVKYDESALKLTEASIAGLEPRSGVQNIESNRNYLRAAEIYNGMAEATASDESALRAKNCAEHVIERMQSAQSKEGEYLNLKASLQLARSLLLLKDFSAAISEYEKILKAASKMKDQFQGEAIGEAAIEGVKTAFEGVGKPDALKSFLVKHDLSGKYPPLIRAANDMAIADVYFPEARLVPSFQNAGSRVNRNPYPDEKARLADLESIKRAEQYLREALMIRQHLEQSLSTEEVLHSLQSLARYDQLMSNRFGKKELVPESEALARQELAILDRASQGSQSSRKAYAYLDLATALEAGGKSKEAEMYIEKFNLQLDATKGYSLEDRQKQLAAGGNGPDLKLARAIFERGASCYGRGDIANARKLAQHSAELVLTFKPADLQADARKQAAEILDTCSCIQDAGSKSAVDYKKLSDEYRYFVK